MRKSGSDVPAILAGTLPVLAILVVLATREVDWEALKHELRAKDQMKRNRAMEMIFAGDRNPTIAKLLRAPGSRLHDDLIDSLSDDDPVIRMSATFLLGLLKEERSIAPMLAKLERSLAGGDFVTDVEGRDIDITVHSIEAISGQHFGGDVASWKGWLRRRDQQDSTPPPARSPR